MDDGPGDLIFLGAEAEVRRSRYLGLATVQKRRVPKPYRHAELDARIRRERTRLEAQLLAEAQRGGVRTPRVLDVDLEAASMELEYVEGPQLRAALEQRPAAGPTLCRAFGRVVARLHAAGLVHGDLTTSNVVVRGDGLVLLDFGLAQRSRDLEDRGVDLLLVERTFESSHPGAPAFLESFRQGYAEASPEAAAVYERVAAIKARGRYV